MTPPDVNSVYVNVDDLEWEASPFPGIRVKTLWKSDDSDAYTALFHVEPGSKLPRHRHCGIEQTFVIEGSLVDDDGACTAGNFVWRPAGSVHSAHSPDGCLAIGVFQCPNEFLE